MSIVYNTKRYIKKLTRESQRAYSIPLVSDSISRMFKNYRHKGRKLACVDLGSHIGTFARHSSHLFDYVYGYEPSVLFFRESKKVLAGIENVHITNKGISQHDNKQLVLREVIVEGLSEGKDVTSCDWDEEGLIQFHGELGPVHGIADSVSWKAISAEVGDVYFLKCDIEGAEYEALIAADLSNVSFLAMELHYTALGPERTIKLLQKLESQFDFLDRKDQLLFKSWPPPSMVYLVNRNYQSGFLPATKALFSVRNSIKGFVHQGATLLRRRFV
jgi:FkbM family methyltransferase